MDGFIPYMGSGLGRCGIGGQYSGCLLDNNQSYTMRKEAVEFSETSLHYLPHYTASHGGQTAAVDNSKLNANQLQFREIVLYKPTKYTFVKLTF
jgi:hypothetical protein